jgi:hypothetical protein
LTNVIVEYIAAEKVEALLILLLGMITITISVFLFLKKDPYFVAMSVPIFSLSIIQLVVGFTVYFRSDAQSAELVRIFQIDPSQFKNVELLRMNIVMNAFKIYKIIEICFLLLSILALFYSIPSQKESISGFFLGLSIQSLTFLIIDFFAEPRGFEYLEKIKQLTN